MGRNLSAELFHHDKPDHEAYLMAAAMLELKPEEVMLGAAHTTQKKAQGNSLTAGLRRIYEVEAV